MIFNFQYFSEIIIVFLICFSPFFGEEFQFEIPRTFRHLCVYVFDRDRHLRQDRPVGKVRIFYILIFGNFKILGFNISYNYFLPDCTLHIYSTKFLSDILPNFASELF